MTDEPLHELLMREHLTGMVDGFIVCAAVVVIIAMSIVGLALNEVEQ
jgi:hypothetical protein